MTLLSEIAGRRLRLPAPVTRDVTVQRDLPATMDDGVELLGDRWVQTDRIDEPQPTVLVRTPYGRTQWVGLLFGRLLAERGLQAVVQSTRGSFGSGGDFRPFDERPDGLATLRWLREQPWHDGGVGTIGPSYLGLVQWAIADEVDALAPSITASRFRDMAMGSGALGLDTAMSWLLMLDVQEDRFAPLLMARGLRGLNDVWDHLPLGDIDERALGAPSPIWREWLGEMAPDSPYWESRDFSSSVSDIEAPVQLVGGWQDIFLPWLVEDWHALREKGRKAQLIIGPGAHISPILMSVGLREGIAWLRAHLLGDDRLVRDTPVRVFVGGEDHWRDLEDWPPPGAKELVLRLQPDGGLSADAPPADAEPTRFTYDPADPTPAVGGAVLLERRPVQDNRTLEARDDVVTFTGEPLAADLEALGPVRADIRFRSSRGDTDVFVRVCDVHPDGTSLNVCDALLRLTPEEPARDDDGVATVDFPLWPTAHRFRAGHRVRIQISSGAHPRYARNPGTGEDPVKATELVKAEQEVFHDAARPSSVALTVQ